MKQDAEAQRLMRGIDFNVAVNNVNYNPYNDSATRDAFLLYITARYFPARLPQLPATVLTALVKQINDGTYHTLSIGANLLALDAYATATVGQVAQLSINEVLHDRTMRALQLPAGVLPMTAFTPQAMALQFNNGSKLNAFYLLEQSGFERAPPTQVIKQSLEVIREYTDAQGKPVTQATLGQELTVHLKFRSLGQRSFGTIALVDLLPGGFELVVPTSAATNTHYQAETEGDAETNASAGEDSEGDSESPDVSDTNVDASSVASGWSCQVCATGTTAQLSYADMREDRMVFYAYTSSDIREVTYRIKATNVGSFVLPPAYGEAMYDRNVIARSAAGKINVVRAP